MPLTLRGTSYGGGIRLDLGLEGSQGSPTYARIYDSKRKKVPGVRIATGQITTSHPLPPGPYTLTIGANGYKYQSKVLQVEAGKVTTGRIFLTRQ